MEDYIDMGKKGSLPVKEEKSMKETLEEISEKLENQKKNKKEKKFTIPFWKRPTKKNIKDGYVIALIWEENNCVDILKLPMVDNTIKVGDTFHSVLSENIGLYKGKFPFVHINKWRSDSFSPQESYNEAQENKITTYGQKLVMSRMISDAIKGKPKISGSIIIWLVIICVVGYLIFGGGI